ncbi:hypothetical protein PR202_gb15278 [Eleusine coracana subsp. coracana]|uniref:Probable purine permease n=1 Tax=Eleusine coracana subsp. coracana TaxID=191504 RepID=A0AAV5EV41_ELECO|nr:hypothetical protein PR202_gb15278 [Eleusine coracana subsp. coracana]
MKLKCGADDEAYSNGAPSIQEASFGEIGEGSRTAMAGGAAALWVHVLIVDLHVSVFVLRDISSEDSGHGEVPGSATTCVRKRRSFRWWALVLADMLMLLCGEAMSPLLVRFYYNSGGSSLWMATLAQSAGAPLLLVPLLLTPRPSAAATAGEPRPAAEKTKIAAVCVGIGVLRQPDALVRHAVPARLHLLAPVRDAAGLQRRHVAPLQRAAVHGARPQLRRRAHLLVLQVCTNVAASTVSVVALLASGEWRGIRGEMDGFSDGRARYVLTLAGIAVGWQAATLGAMRLIARVSSLFANVTGTLALPLVPVFAVVFFGDRMTGIKVVAMLMAVWGFLSYVYQHYLDNRRARAAARKAAGGCSVCAARMRSQARSITHEDTIRENEVKGRKCKDRIGNLAHTVILLPSGLKSPTFISLVPPNQPAVGPSPKSEHRNGRKGDCDGLLFGRAARPPAPPPSLSDDDSAPVSSAPSLSISIAGHASLARPSFLSDPLGRFHLHKSSFATDAAVGFFSSRRRAALRPSMREAALARSLSETLALTHPVVFLLVSPSSSPDLSVHSNVRIRCQGNYLLD